MSHRITKQEIICVQTNEWAQDNFKDILLDWANQLDGPIYVELVDYDDLQEYCEDSSYRMKELLQQVHERCLEENIESILFF